MVQLSARQFCDITASVAHYLKEKERMYWNSAYQKQKLFIVRLPYVLVNEWNTNDYWEYDPATNVWTQKADFGGTARYVCSVYVVPKDGTEPKKHCDHSVSDCGYSCKIWIPKDWICIYSSGDFVSPGPWEQDIPRILFELDNAVKTEQKLIEIKKQEEEAQDKKEREERILLAKETVEQGRI